MVAAQYDYHISSMFFLPNGMVENSLSLSHLFLIRSAKSANTLFGFEIHP